MFLTSPNCVYLVWVCALTQIQPYGWTSDTLGTLGEMLTLDAKNYILVRTSTCDKTF